MESKGSVRIPLSSLELELNLVVILLELVVVLELELNLVVTLLESDVELELGLIWSSLALVLLLTCTSPGTGGTGGAIGSK